MKNEEILNKKELKAIVKGLKEIKALKKEKMIEIIKKLHNNSEVRSAELECSQGGYELGLEDVLNSL